jgi:hypothetical protein
MANTITKTTLLDGPRNLVQLINIAGEAAGTDETNTVLVDRSTFSAVEGQRFSVVKIEGLLTGFSAALSFDATADLVFVRLPDGDWFSHDWSEFGGISSDLAGAGAIGDILLSTTGLTVAADVATFIMHMRKY